MSCHWEGDLVKRISGYLAAANRISTDCFVSTCRRALTCRYSRNSWASSALQ